MSYITVADSWLSARKQKFAILSFPRQIDTDKWAVTGFLFAASTARPTAAALEVETFFKLMEVEREYESITLHCVGTAGALVTQSMEYIPYPGKAVHSQWREFYGSAPETLNEPMLDFDAAMVRPFQCREQSRYVTVVAVDSHSLEFLQDIFKTEGWDV